MTPGSPRAQGSASGSFMPAAAAAGSWGPAPAAGPGMLPGGTDLGAENPRCPLEKLMTRNRCECVTTAQPCPRDCLSPSSAEHPPGSRPGLREAPRSVPTLRRPVRTLRLHRTLGVGEQSPGGEWRMGEEGMAERAPACPPAHVGCPRRAVAHSGTLTAGARAGSRPHGPPVPSFAVPARQTALPWPALSEAL